MTTHETEEILPLADQVLVLENGLAAVQGTSRGVFSQPRRLEAAGVKVPALLQVQSQVAEVGGSDGDLRVEASVAQVAAEVRRAVSRGELTLQDPPSPVAAVQPTEGAPIVEVEDLTMTYPASPPVVALSKMNLTLHEGEFAAIIGQNGSGKSTLVKCLVGLLRPALGRVRFRGQDIRRLSVGEMARRVGLVLQNPDYQLFTSSCREEVRFGLKNLHLPAGEIEERCDQALAAVGLLEQADVFPFRLSFGDRRKLAVAATLALRPEVLILDEPTTAQDYRGRYQLAELARSFHDEQGGTVVIISHDVDLVARYAERVIVLQAGHVLLDGPSAQVFAQEERLKESFVVSPVLMQLAHELSDLGLPSGWTDPEEFAQMLRPAGREEGVR
jgi:energy-coupling factor transport system ATP-binding protein